MPLTTLALVFAAMPHSGMHFAFKWPTHPLQLKLLLP